MNEYYKTDEFLLIKDDCLKALKELDEHSIDMIFADPPYFLSGGGISCHSGKQVCVNKGEWDRCLEPNEKLAFNRAWISLCKRLLKDSGTIWISGTLHNIYSIGLALELEGFSIINNVTWQKPNPPPNLSCRCFTHSTETIIWAKKKVGSKKYKHYFDYKLMKEINGGKQMKDVWNINLPYPKEKVLGKHPTQKPIRLLERIVLASTKENELILDPFCGSGTTGVACLFHNRKFIGIENNTDYIELSKKRLVDCLKEK